MNIHTYFKGYSLDILITNHSGYDFSGIVNYSIYKTYVFGKCRGYPAIQNPTKKKTDWSF